jgi:hypothetical protein
LEDCSEVRLAKAVAPALLSFSRIPHWLLVVDISATALLICVPRTFALGQPCRQCQHRPGWQRPVAGHYLSQQGPGDVGLSQPHHCGLYVGIHHQSREEAAHLPRRGYLAGKPRPEFWIGCQLGADNLHGHRPPARWIAQEDPPHAAAAQFSHQAVRTDQIRISRLLSAHHADPTHRHKDTLTPIERGNHIKAAM